jgi:4'-phosphopantetheinyl transferase
LVDAADGQSGILIAALRLDMIGATQRLRLEALLSAEERDEAARFRFAANQLEYVAAHGLLRLVLSGLCAVPAQDLAFARTAFGKSFLADKQGPYFSISHCTGMVVCAISREWELGVDVEPLDRRAPLDLADRYFCEAERAALLALPQARRASRFFELWTLKEAVVKATGRGLSQGLQSFAIGFDPLGVTVLDPHDGAQAPWRLHQRELCGAYVLGLAWRGDAAEICFEDDPLLRLGPSPR